MTTTETIYRVTTETNVDGGQYYSVVDADGDEVDNFETLRDATVEADERNVNAAIEDAIGGLENLLTSLTESRSLTVLKALRQMIETAENLEEE